MPARKRSIIYPNGADLKLLKRLEKKREAERTAVAKAEHAAFERHLKEGLRDSSPFAKAFGLDREVLVRQVSARRKAHQKALAKLKAPEIQPLKAHNPTRYAPFDLPWSWVSGGGITALTPYGPNVNTGRTGYSIAIFNGGSVSTVSSVGFWYYAGESGSLHITLNANIWGRAFVYSALFGYASAYAGLRVWVERNASDFRTWSATTPIYNNNGVVEFDLREFNWVTRTVSITVPVRARTWYSIWGDAVQSAGAGGIADAVSNFSMYMGPVNYWLD